MDIVHGDGAFNRWAIALAGFPPPGVNVPLRITVSRHPDGEEWLRSFDGHQTRSVIRFHPETQQLSEAFGPVTCLLSLTAQSGSLVVGTPATKLFGVRLPYLLSPQSRSSEYSDRAGRLCFDISAFWPNNHLIIRYSGHLEVPDLGTTAA
ncbi:DUF4166 domain-containing protein [Roseobacter sp. A03A-229]